MRKALGSIFLGSELAKPKRELSERCESGTGLGRMCSCLPLPPLSFPLLPISSANLRGRFCKFFWFNRTSKIGAVEGVKVDPGAKTEKKMT
jgi:hypothetical protein